MGWLSPSTSFPANSRLGFRDPNQQREVWWNLHGFPWTCGPTANSQLHEGYRSLILDYGGSGPQGWETVARLLPWAGLPPPTGGGLLPFCPELCLFSLGRAGAASSGNCPELSAVPAAALWHFLSPSSRAESSLAPTQRSMVVHGLLPQGQEGVWKMPSVAARGPRGPGWGCRAQA